MSQWDYGMPPPPEHHDPYAGDYADSFDGGRFGGADRFGAGPFRADRFDHDRFDHDRFDDESTAPYPITWERDPFESAARRLGLPDEDWGRPGTAGGAVTGAAPEAAPVAVPGSAGRAGLCSPSSWSRPPARVPASS